MKYLCLIYGDESAWQSRPQQDLDAMTAEYLEYTRKYRQTGHILGGDALLPTGSATTIRVRDGKMSTTDGPFAETREQLAGYYLIEARDLNEAIQVASGIHGAKTGSIEVRPIRSMPQFEPLYQQAVTA